MKFSKGDRVTSLDGKKVGTVMIDEDVDMMVVLDWDDPEGSTVTDEVLASRLKPAES